MNRITTIFLLTVTLCGTALTAHAAEIGHFNGGLLNIRDYVVPEPGLYGALYNYFYTTNQLNDRHGDETNAVTINPRGGRGVTLGVDVDLDIYALAPTFIWVTDLKPLGLPLKYGVAISLPFTNTSLGASLSTATGRGGTVDAGSFNIGDMFVQPV